MRRPAVGRTVLDLFDLKRMSHAMQSHNADQLITIEYSHRMNGSRFTQVLVEVLNENNRAPARRAECACRFYQSCVPACRPRSFRSRTLSSSIECCDFNTRIASKIGCRFRRPSFFETCEHQLFPQADVFSAIENRPGILSLTDMGQSLRHSLKNRQKSTPAASQFCRELFVRILAGDGLSLHAH